MIYTQSSLNDPAWCKFQIFGETSGSEDRGRDDNNVQFINIGRMGDKSFKELQ